MNTITTTPANFTRRTADLPAKFRREGRLALIPLYHFLQLSDLAREGIAHSGSYRFADHLYRNEASGTGWLGRWLDRRLLNLAAARAMRSRYLRAVEEMLRAFREHFAAGNDGPFRIRTVPCGIPRDVRDFVAELARQHPELPGRVVYEGMDLDPKVCQAARDFLATSAIAAPRIFQGNALDDAGYDDATCHFISSTGLGEFLDDEDLSQFYANVFAALAPGGTFYTSAAAFDSRSDALLRTFELKSHYRTVPDLQRLLSIQPWARVEFARHPSGLQTFVRATK
jgi:hypothetical protein